MIRLVDRAHWFHGRGARCGTPPAAPARPYRLALLGPPGVGKGTQAEQLCATLGACHLSTGDVFRAARDLEADRRGPALTAALEKMRLGELVPDEIVVAMVRERAGCLRCSSGFLLDGFPRTVHQAAELDAILLEQGVSLDAALCYDLPLDEIVARLSGRRTCTSCKAVYHLTARPPNLAGFCDTCGGRLFQREDDRPESIVTRMRVYEESAQPLMAYYRERGKLIVITADGTPDEILTRSLAAIRNL